MKLKLRIQELTSNIILASVILLIFSCSNIDRRTDKEIEALIQKNTDSILFLSFWKNISKKDFNRVLKLENQKENLTGNNFLFKIPSDSYLRDFDNIEFKIVNRNDFINLNYVDEFWVENKWGDLLPSEDGSERGKYYERIETELVNLFDSKYTRIKDYPYQTHYAWKIKEKVDRIVILNIYKNVWKKPDHNSTIAFGPHKDEDKKRIRFAKCEIDLNYSLYQDYLKDVDKRKIEQFKFQKRKELERMKAEKKNNVL